MLLDAENLRAGRSFIRTVFCARFPAIHLVPPLVRSILSSGCSGTVCARQDGIVVDGLAPKCRHRDISPEARSDEVLPRAIKYKPPTGLGRLCETIPVSTIRL